MTGTQCSWPSILFSLPILLALSSCSTDPETSRRVLGISGPATVLHKDELKRLSDIDEVRVVEDALLLGEDHIKVHFRPVTQDCRTNKLFGGSYCSTDKGPVEESETYLKILDNLAHVCASFKKKEITKSNWFNRNEYTLHVVCDGQRLPYRTFETHPSVERQDQ